MKKNTNISEISNDGNQDDEFIVKLDFYYSEVTYTGYVVLDRNDILILQFALKSKYELYTPNMPGSWCEEFDISLLKDAFTIHSSDKEDIAAMRSLFGDSVGNTDLYDQIIGLIEEEFEQLFFGDDDLLLTERHVEFIMNHPKIEQWWIGAATGITEAGAKLLSRYKGEICFEVFDLSKLDDSVFPLFQKYKCEMLAFPIKMVNVDSALKLKKVPNLCLYSIDDENLSDEVAEVLAKHEGKLTLIVGSLTDKAAKALSLHVGPLDLEDIEEISEKARRHLESNDEVALPEE